jgi:murein DD-endopeptidase MepM/ murein hydrolase activator NlpD
MAPHHASLSELASLALIAGTACLACADDPTSSRTTSGIVIAITPDVLTLPVGTSTTLDATVTDLEGRPLPSRELDWSSSAPEIVSVSPAGVITAVSPGRASVGAHSELVAGFARIVVQMNFLLPVGPGAVLIAEIGSPTSLCPGGEGGLREDGGRECSHAGISRYSLDFRAPGDVPLAAQVAAAADGTVSDVCLQPPPQTTCGPDGPFVQVDHGFGFASYYSHLDPASITVRRKTAVTQGEVLGRMSVSDAQGNPWTHFEVRYEKQDAAQRRILDGLVLAGRKLTDYRLGE